MAARLFQTLLVRPRDIAPSDDSLEVIGAFNPAAIEHDDGVTLLVRVAQRPRETRDGFTAAPRWEAGRVVTNWIANDEIEFLDPRVIRQRADGLLRLTFTSHLLVMYSRDGRSIDRWNAASLFPQEPWEAYGVEDPRVVRLGDRYWVTYVAVSPHGAATALASTQDFATFERHGVIFCPENKDVVLFPEQVNGSYVALHRPNTAHPFCRPEIWLAQSPDLLHWGAHQPLHGGASAWESDRVGGGAPPLKTASGWLEIYHASRRAQTGVGVYAAGAMLLDLDAPGRVIAHSRQPLWEPEADYELAGFVPGVVFPTGAVARGGILQIYYGAADTYTAMVEMRLDSLLAELYG